MSKNPHVPCYCRGTLIRAADGELLVEELAIGDRVVTISGEAPIRWIGRRAYDSRFLAGNRGSLPVRIGAAALATGVPARDLWVSPGHALYIEGKLVWAKYLLNGATIIQAESVDRLEYFHIEFDQQEIIFAEGAPAESYVECDNRMQFANCAEYAQLYPDDNRTSWQYCAPLVKWGSEELSAIRKSLLERAQSLGHAVVSDPDLRLIVGYEIVRPAMVIG